MLNVPSFDDLSEMRGHLPHYCTIFGIFFYETFLFANVERFINTFPAGFPRLVLDVKGLDVS